MKIFALSDPHLALGIPGKSMDVFGWHRHHRTIEETWRAQVADEDLVLVAGDISWAMRIPEAQADLGFLGRLPGRKVIIKGNHDYWWSSLGKVKRVLPEGMFALQGDALRIDDVVLCGTRMWDVPGVGFDGWIDWQPNPVAAEPSEASPDVGLRIYERELARLERALEQMAPLSQPEPRLRIVMVHYPPCTAELGDSPVTALIERYRVDHVVFGHLHAILQDGRHPFGIRGNTQYHLTSCDFLGFSPLLIDPPATP